MTSRWSIIEEIRVYQVYLTDERKLAPASVCMVSGALRFLYHVTLKRGWVETEIPLPKKPFKLPVILSPEEIMCFLECVHSLKMRTLLRTTYAAGLRVSEANPLQGCGPSGRRAYGTANRPRHQRHVRKTGRATRLERLQGTPPAVLI